MRQDRDQDSIGQGDQTRKPASAAYPEPFKRHELNENKTPMTLRHPDDTKASNMPACQPLCSVFVHAVCWALEGSTVRLSLSGSHPTKHPRLGDLGEMARFLPYPRKLYSFQRTARSMPMYMRRILKQKAPCTCDAVAGLPAHATHSQCDSFSVAAGGRRALTLALVLVVTRANFLFL